MIPARRLSIPLFTLRIVAIGKLTSGSLPAHLSRQAVGLLPLCRSCFRHPQARYLRSQKSIMGGLFARILSELLRRPYAHHLDLQYEDRHNEMCSVSWRDDDPQDFSWSVFLYKYKQPIRGFPT